MVRTEGGPQANGHIESNGEAPSLTRWFLGAEAAAGPSWGQVYRTWPMPDPDAERLKLSVGIFGPSLCKSARF